MSGRLKSPLRTRGSKLLKYDFVLFLLLTRWCVTHAYHNVTHTSPSSDTNPQTTHPLKLLLYVKGNSFFPACLPIYIHHCLEQQCLSDVSACRALSPNWFLCSMHQCAHNSSLTVHKPENLCFALEFFLRFDHLLIVLFCLSSKFCILLSQQIFFSCSLKAVSIPLHSSKKILIKKCIQSNKVAVCLSAITLSN